MSTRLLLTDYLELQSVATRRNVEVLVEGPSKKSADADPNSEGIEVILGITAKTFCWVGVKGGV